MQIRSHVLLANYLLKQIPDSDSAVYRKVFIWGCIEPDFNIFSYLKGSLKCQKLRGHNYNSSSRYTGPVLEKLRGKGHWGLREYYRLGKLMHYLADAFTYPHNDDFTGTLREHRAYEARLHSRFAAYLKQRGEEYPEDYPENCPEDYPEDYPEDIREYIGEVHKQYMSMPGEMNNDAEFITRATYRVMRALTHSLTSAYEQCEVAYENSYYDRLVRSGR